MTDIHSVIAFETDALFTTRKLDLKYGTGLGEWELTEFSRLAYVQSGFYFGDTIEGKTINKTRGVDRCKCRKNPCECEYPTLTWTDALAAISHPVAAERAMNARASRFVGAGLALAQDWGKWRTWETTPKRIAMNPPGSKRTHEWCDKCDEGTRGDRLGVWHDTACYILGDNVSKEFAVLWANRDPEMEAMNMLRLENLEEWGDLD
jgi:hypothetical protein